MSVGGDNYRGVVMIELPYSLVIESTTEPDFFGFYSPDLAGFSGVGHSLEDCLYRAKWGMKEHIELLAEQNMQIPERNNNPTILIQNTRQSIVNSLSAVVPNCDSGPSASDR